MNKIEISNGAVSVRNSSFTPRCLDINTHVTDRDVKVSANYWPPRDKSHKDGPRAHYISMKLEADEENFEVPGDETDEYRRRATEQNTFISVEDARAFRDALTVALDCADIK